MSGNNRKIVSLATVVLVSLLQVQLRWALYFDFEDNAQLKQWDVLGTWKIVKDNNKGSNVLSGEGANEVCALVGEVNWTDYTIELEASGQTDEISVVFRGKDANTFLSFMVAPSLNLSEFFQKLGGAFDENIAQKGDSLGVKIQEWHKYKLVVQSNKASIFVDDKEVIKALDLGKFPKDFEKGRVGVRQWSDRAYYDNILVTGTGIPRTPGEPGLSITPAGRLSMTWGTLKYNSVTCR